MKKFLTLRRCSGEQARNPLKTLLLMMLMCVVGAQTGWAYNATADLKASDATTMYTFYLSCYTDESYYLDKNDYASKTSKAEFAFYPVSGKTNVYQIKDVTKGTWFTYDASNMQHSANQISVTETSQNNASLFEITKVYSSVAGGNVYQIRPFNADGTLTYYLSWFDGPANNTSRTTGFGISDPTASDASKDNNWKLVTAYTKIAGSYVDVNAVSTSLGADKFTVNSQGGGTQLNRSGEDIQHMYEGCYFNVNMNVLYKGDYKLSYDYAVDNDRKGCKNSVYLFKENGDAGTATLNYNTITLSPATSSWATYTAYGTPLTLTGMEAGNQYVRIQWASSPTSGGASGNFKNFVLTKTAGYVTYNYNDGTRENEEVKVTLGKALSTPTRAGYTFDGWYDGDTKITTFNRVDNPTLTAQWTEIPNGTATYQHDEMRAVNICDGNQNTRLFVDNTTADKGLRDQATSIACGDFYINRSHSSSTTKVGNTIALKAKTESGDRQWQNSIVRYDSYSCTANNRNLSWNADNFDWFHIDYTAPSYTKITYTIGMGIHVAHSNNGCEVRAAYFDYGTDYTTWNSRATTPKTTTCPNGSTSFYTANIYGSQNTGWGDATSANILEGETQAMWEYKTTDEKWSDGYYTYTFDNSNSATASQFTRYGGFSSSKTEAASGSTFSTSMLLCIEACTMTYFKQVTYDANGGTGTMDVATVGNGEALPVCTFTRDGYAFAGWSTSKDGTKLYDDKGVLSVTPTSKGPLTLYAIWEDACAEVSFGTTTVNKHSLGEAIKWANANATADCTIKVLKDNSYDVGDTKLTWNNSHNFTIDLGDDASVVSTITGNGSVSTLNNTIYDIWEIDAGKNEIGGNGTLNMSSNSTCSNLTFIDVECNGATNVTLNFTGNAVYNFTTSTTASQYHRSVAARDNASYAGKCVINVYGGVFTSTGYGVSQFVDCANNANIYFYDGECHWSGAYSSWGGCLDYASAGDLYVYGGKFDGRVLVSSTTGKFLAYGGKFTASDIKSHLAEGHTADQITEDGKTYYYVTPVVSVTYGTATAYKASLGAAIVWANSNATADCTIKVLKDNSYTASSKITWSNAHNFNIDLGAEGVTSTITGHGSACEYGNGNPTVFDIYSGANTIGGYGTLTMYDSTTSGTFDINRIVVSAKSDNQTVSLTFNDRAKYNFTTQYGRQRSIISHNTKSGGNVNVIINGGVFTSTGVQVSQLVTIGNNGNAYVHGGEFHWKASTTTWAGCFDYASTGEFYVYGGYIDGNVWYSKATSKYLLYGGKYTADSKVCYEQGTDKGSYTLSQYINVAQYGDGLTRTAETINETIDGVTYTEAIAEAITVPGGSTNSAVWETYLKNNPNAIGYVSAASKVSKTNVFVAQSDGTTYVAPSLVITDGKAFTMPDALSGKTCKAASATYSRNQSDYNWGTLCLPYDITVSEEDEVAYYNLASVEGSTMSFTKITAGTKIDAGTPVIIKKNGTASFTSTGDITVVGTASAKEGTWTLHGTLTAIDRMPEGYFFNGDKFWYTDYANYPADVKIPAYRCYFTTTSSNAKKASFNLMAIDGDSTTQIGTIDAEGKATFFENGKYIQNGQIVIVKNGKKYNAAGQEIK